MAVNKLKVMLSFMREINEGNIPTADVYELENGEYWDIINACQDEGYIKGAAFISDGNSNYFAGVRLEDVKLTIKGMEYLEENSMMMQTYKGLKEIREWLRF